MVENSVNASFNSINRGLHADRVDNLRDSMPDELLRNILLNDIKALHGETAEAKDIYPVVCELLFFQYGIVPTASKLHHVVHMGSMRAAARAVAKFWDDLRNKTRVKIDHPDLPWGLKTSAAEAIASLWRQATIAARHEFAMLHLEDRRAHTSAVEQLQELQRQFEQARDQAQAYYSFEISKARNAVGYEDLRLDAIERRAPIDIEAELKKPLKLDEQLEMLRGQVAQIESLYHENMLVQADAVARLKTKAEATERSQLELAARNRTLVTELQAVRDHLAASRRELSQSRVEAQTLRVLLDRLPQPNETTTQQEAVQASIASKFSEGKDT